MNTLRKTRLQKTRRQPPLFLRTLPYALICAGVLATSMSANAASESTPSSSTHDMSGMSGMSGMSDMSDMQAAPAPSSSSSSPRSAPASDPANIILPETASPVPMANPAVGVSMPGMEMHDDAIHHQILFDQLGYQSVRGVSGVEWDMSAWVGTDFNRLFVRSEGQRIRGGWDDVRIEAAWSHALDRYWNGLLGMRTDLGAGPTRYWGMVGLQGTMPWFLNVSAMAYAGPSGRTALWARAEYDWRLTQRLILTPELEVNAYGKRDAAREVGAGLSDITASLRLRYEVSRKVAPYIGINWQRRIGETAAMARGDGVSVNDIGIQAGVRIWF
ncbi:copper resistance protein B [Robbsia sp. KACC 23696]|uniref:copper resistance protein B n=1 Tax=Robbsia sp. KACC 23696 TaxID=3149231 RepID=UPI00325A86CE